MVLLQDIFQNKTTDFIMKINISTLITYATYSTCLIDQVGWLQKRGQVNMNFQKAILCSERQHFGGFF